MQKAIPRITPHFLLDYHRENRRRPIHVASATDTDLPLSGGTLSSRDPKALHTEAENALELGQRMSSLFEHMDIAAPAGGELPNH